MADGLFAFLFRFLGNLGNVRGWSGFPRHVFFDGFARHFLLSLPGNCCRRFGFAGAVSMRKKFFTSLGKSVYWVVKRKLFFHEPGHPARKWTGRRSRPRLRENQFPLRTRHIRSDLGMKTKRYLHSRRVWHTLWMMVTLVSSALLGPEWFARGEHGAS